MLDIEQKATAYLLRSEGFANLGYDKTNNYVKHLINIGAYSIVKEWASKF